jgi:hypothetical protein
MDSILFFIVIVATIITGLVGWNVLEVIHFNVTCQKKDVHPIMLLVNDSGAV